MIMIVGEAWGKEEEEVGAPFVGPSGRLLRGMLSQVGIAMSECHVTNVFNFRPKPSNDIQNLCGSRVEGIPSYPALTKGKFVRLEYTSELDRLFTEIQYVNPTLIIALGSTAAWALLKTTGIKHIRGAPLLANINGHSVKVLPTYHPAAVLREWSLRPILLADLHKAKREAGFREVVRPSREIWIEPNLEDMFRFEREHILPSPELSIDIETAGDQITCIGFAPTKSIALVVPFTKATPPFSYWPTLQEEMLAWNWVRHICSLPKKVVGQNFLYDMHFLWRGYGIPVPGAANDTMLLHHALQPEMEKSLGFLGSVYTDEASWKFMRKNETIKKED